MTSERATAAGELERAPTHVVQALLHFLRVVRYRQSVVATALVVCILLGVLYYATATRLFQSKASLLVLQTGVDVTNASMTADSARQNLMPTYERLFSSAVVLEQALNYLQPADSADLQKIPRDRWLGMVRDNLTANTIRQTNIIEVSYRSKEPKTCVAMVNAVLKSYLDFMDKTHKGTAGEIINVLTKEKVQLEQKLATKEQEVLAARRQYGDLGIRPGEQVVHPMVQRAIGLNEALIKTQQKRLELQASCEAIQTSIRKGEDLQPHMLTLEGAVGREFLLNALGFGNRDATVQASMEKQLLEDQAELRGLQDFYGPKHPKVLELAGRVRLTEDYLSGYQARVNQKLSSLRDKQLGPMLMQMVQQRLSETWQHENSLRKSFEQARAEAVNMNGDMARLEILEHDLKWLRDLHDVLLNQIAGIDLKQDHADIRTAVVSEPTLPKNPIWPKLPLVAACCLVAGLGGGIALVYVLDILDDRFRSPEELRSQLGAPVLAMVRQMDDLQALGLAGIHVHVTPDAVTSEAFRTLRTTLAFANQDTTRMVISSAEPGDGKTTVMANLAVSYVQSGKKTLLIDADLRRPGLTNLMGMKGQGGLTDLLAGGGPVPEVAAQFVRNTDLPGFDFLPAGPRRPNPAELLGGSRLADLLAWAEPLYDQILIDSPPALAASDASIIGRLVDGVVLVVQPRKNQRRLVLRAAESFTALGVTLLGMVVNRVTADKGDAIYGYSSYGYGYGYGYGDGYGQDTDGDTSHVVPLQPAAAETVGDTQVPRRVA